MTGMYLEHYGVKGMKWGVRKEYESSSTKRSSILDKRADDSKSNHKENFQKVTPFSYVQLRETYNTFESLAKDKMDKKIKLLNLEAVQKNDNTINDTTGAKGNALWAESYREALNDMDLDLKSRMALTAYAALVEAGIDKDFVVVLVKRNGRQGYAYQHRISGQIFYTLGSARQYMRTVGSRTREKNVKGEPVAIKVDKSKSTGGSSSGYNDVPNAYLKDITRKMKTENMVKDAMQSIGKTLMSKAKR